MRDGSRLSFGDRPGCAQRRADISFKFAKSLLQLEETAGLKADFRFLEIGTDCLAQAVGGTDALTGKNGEQSGGILANFLLTDVLLHSPCGVAHAIDGGAQVPQQVFVDLAGEEELFQIAESFDRVLKRTSGVSLGIGRTVRHIADPQTLFSWILCRASRRSHSRLPRRLTCKQHANYLRTSAN